MDLHYILEYIETTESSIESIVEVVGDYVDHYASEVQCLDRDIKVQLAEYGNCDDPDYRLLYYEDIDTLVGQRNATFDELFDSIETGREALGKIQALVDAANERLDELEGSDRVPEDADITVPPIEPRCFD